MSRPAGPSRPPARWTAAAKATAVVLTLTTVGAAGFGIAQFTKVNDQRDTIAGLQGEIDDTNDDYDDLSERLDAAKRHDHRGSRVASTRRRPSSPT